MEINFRAESSSVSLSLGNNFSVLVGEAVQLNRHSVLLLGADQFLPESQVEEILKSGIKVGCTYPASLLIDPRIDEIHIFKSFNEPWALPYGWTLYAVSSGCGSNWLFRKKDSETVLVCGASAIVSNGLYREISSLPYFKVDRLVVLPFYRDGDSLDVINRLLSSSEPTDSLFVQVRNGVEAVSLAVACSHYIAAQPSHLQGPVLLLGNDLEKQIRNFSSLFEWLSPEVGVYLMKCVKYVSDRNEMISSPFVLSDLVEENRVIFSNEARKAKLTISLTQGTLKYTPFSFASVDDLEKLYRPIHVLA
jgi:hypothetical protein